MRVGDSIQHHLTVKDFIKYSVLGYVFEDNSRNVYKYDESLHHTDPKKRFRYNEDFLCGCWNRFGRAHDAEETALIEKYNLSDWVHTRTDSSTFRVVKGPNSRIRRR